MKAIATKIFIAFFIITASATDEDLVINSSNQSFKCKNDVTTLSIGNFETYLWNTGATTPTITVNEPGYYWVTVIGSDGCGTTSEKYRLSGEGNGALLAIIRTMGNTDLCPGDRVTLFGNEDFRYEWSNGDTINNLVINQPQNLSLTLIDSEGCRSIPSDTLTVTIFDPPKPEITVEGPMDFCNESDNTELIASYDTSLNFYWNTGETSPRLKIKNPGSYNAIISNDTGCEILSEPVFISPLNTDVPSIIASGDYTLCPDEVLTLTSHLNSYAYEWSNGATTKSVDFSEGGNYTFNLVDDDGCRSEISPIEIYQPDIYMPDIFSNGPTTFCNGSSVVLKADVDPDHFWEWQDGSRSIDILVSTSGTFHISALDFESGCRVYSDTVEVTVGSIRKPEINYDSDTIFCKGDSIILYSDPSFGYFWTGPDATEINRRDSTIVVKNGGVYELAHINDIGCVSGSEPLTIVVDMLPNKPGIFGNFNFTINAFEEYTTNTSATTEVLWESNTGTIDFNDQDSVTVYWGSITNADLCVTHTSEHGCDQQKTCISDIITDVPSIELDEIKLSPNPCKDQFEIVGIEPFEIQSIKIYNLNGSLIEVKKKNNSLFYNLKNIPKGTYIVEIKTEKAVYSKKLYKI